MCRKARKYEGQGLHFGALWDYVGAAGEALDDLGAIFAATWGLQALFFAILMEKCDLRISTPFSNRIVLLQVPAPKLEPLGQKSRARSVQNGVEVACQRGQDSQVWQVFSVLL